MCCPSIGEVCREESFGSLSLPPSQAAVVEVLREMRKLDREWIGWSYLSIARDISIASFPPIHFADVVPIVVALTLSLSAQRIVIAQSTCSRNWFHIPAIRLVLHNDFHRHVSIDGEIKEILSCAVECRTIAITRRVIF